MLRKILLIIALAAAAAVPVFTQDETLNNAKVIEMVRNGLSDDIITIKVSKTKGTYDTSAEALVELKKAGVSDAILLVMLQTADQPVSKMGAGPLTYSESGPPVSASFAAPAAPAAPRELVRNANTIALVKSSVQPSRQALEKELMKRPEWSGLGLTIIRYKDQADLYVEIGYVSLSWLTHRYVYRIFDRRSGVVIAAGETTSWGSLSENLARHIARSLRRSAGG